MMKLKQVHIQANLIFYLQTKPMKPHQIIICTCPHTFLQFQTQSFKFKRFNCLQCIGKFSYYVHATSTHYVQYLVYRIPFLSVFVFLFEFGRTRASTQNLRTNFTTPKEKRNCEATKSPLRVNNNYKAFFNFELTNRTLVVRT